MKTRLFKGLIVIFMLLVLTGGVFYMRSNHKHEQVKDTQDTYVAQSDNDDGGILKLLDDPEEEEAISKTLEETRNLLMKHAPHLLQNDRAPEESRKLFLEDLKKHDPEAYAKLQSQLAENDRKYKADIAAINAEADRFKQELINNEAAIEKSRKRRESFELEILERKRESQAIRDRLDRLMDEMREHVILDANGKIVGFNPPSVLPIDSDVSGSPTDVQSVPSDAKQEQPPDLNNNSVGASDFNPQLWRETVNSEIAGLDVGFSEKYPDVMIRPYLSDADYKTLFPTEASRQQLQRRTTELQTEYASGIRKMLSKTPRDRQSKMLELARQALSRDWDSDFVDTVINKVRQDKE